MTVVKGVDCSDQRWGNWVDVANETSSLGIEGVAEDIEKLVARDGRIGRKPCESSEVWGRVDRFVSLVAEECGLGGGT